MTKTIRIAALIVLVGVISIQFIRPDRSAGPTRSDTNIAAAFPVDAEVDGLLDRACYDCHSNGTRYPWYSEVQPVGWWLQGHIDDARQHLNFDEFTTYDLPRQYNKFQEIESEVRDEMMPLDSYLPMHPEARLTPDERAVIVSWAQSLRDSMRAWYPQDSLQRRRARPSPQETRTEPAQ